MKARIVAGVLLFAGCSGDDSGGSGGSSSETGAMESSSTAAAETSSGADSSSGGGETTSEDTTGTTTNTASSDSGTTTDSGDSTGSGETGGGVTVCEEPSDCPGGECETGSCLGPVPGCDLEDVQSDPGNNWSDSYSVDGRCYCDSTFDHAIGDIEIDTPYGVKTVLEICEAIGPGPGAEGNPVYNDIQCGNGPANDAGDEDWCPGRVDLGAAGCCTAGPLWDLTVFE